ncbi:MAG: pentapeptide repeat-containing protein, partial [Cyanobacteria bacterium J06631_6]
MKKILFRFLGLVFVLCLAWLWVLLDAHPAFAQTNTINYSSTNLENRDFSNQDLTAVNFISAEMRGTNFQGADLTNAMFTKGNLLGANLE